MIKQTPSILVLIYLAAAACTSGQQGERPPSPAVTPATSEVTPEIIISTDRALYNQGESIIVTITNGSTVPILFMDNCSLNACFESGKEWICVERECAGPPISLDAGAQMELAQEARSFELEGAFQTHSQYKLAYQFAGEEAYCFAYSNEFSVQKSE